MSDIGQNEKDNGCLPWIVGAVIMGLIATFASDEGNQVDDLSVDVEEWQAEPLVLATPTPADLRSPDRPSIERASLHAGRIVGALGLGGAEKYSSLCYASLADKPELERLDRCYAFDLFAKRLLETTEGYTPVLFDPDTIQSRWQENASQIAADENAMLIRRTAVESQSSLINTDLIAPPERAAVFSEPEVDQAIQPSYNQDQWENTFDAEEPVAMTPMD